MKFHKFTIVLTPEKSKGFAGYYNVSVPALPGCLTYGESLEEARFMAKDAISAYLESLLEDGEEVPSDKKPKRVAKNAVVEEVLVAIDYQVKVDEFPHEFQTAFA